MKSFKIGNGYINSNGVYKRNVSNKKNQKGGRVTMSSQYFGRNTDKYYPAGSSELVHQGNKTLAGHDLSPSQPNNTLTGLKLVVEEHYPVQMMLLELCLDLLLMAVLQPVKHV